MSDTSTAVRLSSVSEGHGVPDPEPTYRTTTVKEIGCSLVIGTANEGIANRSLAFKLWIGEDEEKVGEIRNKNRGMSGVDFSAAVLAHFVTTWGHHDFTTMTAEKRREVIHHAYAADFYQAWISLRIETLGPTYSMRITCPSCNHPFRYDVNLESVDVRQPLPNADLSRPYTMRHPFRLGQETVREIVWSPIRWMAYEGLVDVGINIGQMKLRIIGSAITKVDVKPDPIALPESCLRQWSKVDIERLSTAIEDESFGPDLGLFLNCPKCRMPIETPVQWAYDPFFSA